jgi:hypothetical protein
MSVDAVKRNYQAAARPLRLVSRRFVSLGKFIEYRYSLAETLTTAPSMVIVLILNCSNINKI